MSQAYQIAGTDEELLNDETATLLARRGRFLLPLVQIIEQAECAVGELVDVMGRATLNGAWKLGPEEGIRKTEQYAQWLECQWPSSSARLREGLAETLTAKRLNRPATRCRCLHSTNPIDSSQSGVPWGLR